MRVLLIGGTQHLRGGVEVFCERATTLMKNDSYDFVIDRLWTNSAYLTASRLPLYAAGLARLLASRRHGRGVAWVQYVNLPDLLYAAVARAAGYRVLVTPHLGVDWSSQRNPLLRRLSALLLRSADRLALLSRAQEREIAIPPALPRSLIRTFLPPEALSSSDAKEADANAPLRLVHASRLSAAKGTFLVIAICARLRDAGIPFSAKIIGRADAETKAALERDITERVLVDHINLQDWASPEELMQELRAADVLVHLSRQDSYPLIVLEALASGALPLTLDLAGASEMIAAYDGFVVHEANAVDAAFEILRSNDLADLQRRGAIQAERVRSDFSSVTAAALLADALKQTARVA